MRESTIEDYFVRRCEEAGGEVRKLGWIGRRGAPDRIVFFSNGVSAFVELKATGQKPEPHQLREHQRLRAKGQWVEVIDSKDKVDLFIHEATTYAAIIEETTPKIQDFVRREAGRVG